MDEKNKVKPTLNGQNVEAKSTEKTQKQQFMRTAPPIKKATSVKYGQVTTAPAKPKSTKKNKILLTIMVIVFVLCASAIVYLEFIYEKPPAPPGPPFEIFSRPSENASQQNQNIKDDANKFLSKASSQFNGIEPNLDNLPTDKNDLETLLRTVEGGLKTLYEAKDKFKLCLEKEDNGGKLIDRFSYDEQEDIRKYSLKNLSEYEGRYLGAISKISFYIKNPNLNGPHEEEPPKQEPPKEDPPKVDPPKETPPKEEPPKVDPPKEAPPKEEPPKQEPPKIEPPKEEPPKEESPKVEPPQQEPPQQEPPKEEPPKEEPPQQEPPKVEPPQQEPPKEEPPKVEPPKVEPPQQEPPKIEPPKVEPKQPQKFPEDLLLEEADGNVIKAGDIFKEVCSYLDNLPKNADEVKTALQKTGELVDLLNKSAENYKKIREKHQNDNAYAMLDDDIKRIENINKYLSLAIARFKSMLIEKPPKEEPPKVEPPKEEPPKVEPPKEEPPKVEPPKEEPPKVEPPKEEPPKEEPPKEEPPKEKPPEEQPPEEKKPE